MTHSDRNPSGLTSNRHGTPEITRRRIFGVLLISCVGWGGGPAVAQADHFQDEVAPILQRRCLGCHNDADRKGDFSLQSAPAALEAGYIEPGDAQASYLVELITPAEGRAQMPKDADPLSAEAIAAIRQWIDAGAKWPEGLVLEESKVTDYNWWSYKPVERPAIPELRDPWIRNPIDAFVLQTHQQKGVTHAEAADRRTLIRRLTFDLIGLPPSPAEVQAFVEDPDPQAYEKLVDRLLASEQYGERWARHWLDVVKYADTCGYDKDKLRPNAWPYRDYVIRSLNQDKPYGRFVQEQVAGDVLFPDEADGILGLGFIAAGPWDFIGHVEVPESKLDGKVARNLDRDDMVSNVINTFCSVTIQCARCHNHKFDPFTQDHYYGMQAVFAAVDRADRPYQADPELARKRRDLEGRITSLKSQQIEQQQELEAAGGEPLVRLNAEIAQLQPKLQVTDSPTHGYHSAICSTPDDVKWVTVELADEKLVRRIVLRPCYDNFANIGAGFGFPVRFRVEVSHDGDVWESVEDQTAASVTNPGLVPYTISLDDTPVKQIRVTATQLVERKDDFIFALAELEVFDDQDQNVALTAAVTALDSIEAPISWGKQNLIDGKFPFYNDDALGSQLAGLTRDRHQLMTRIDTPDRIERRAEVSRELREAEQQLASLPPGQMVYAAATHFAPQGAFQPTQGTPRAVSVLRRGQVEDPMKLATPGVLPLGAEADFQLSMDLDEGQRRAAVARWLTERDHPLVWRSIVNRIWQYHFGQGIVATPNDFGRMGATPTHPELLDWLACEFRDGGQSFKQLHRLIVTSNTYRQASTYNDSNAALDGSNQFLWRMPRRRLEAEEVRDAILATSGALDPTMGGPGFYLFVLEKTEHSPHYEYHKFDPTDSASHRRSIYRFIARSQPNPWMVTLDCADSSQSTPRRNETLTSLQALSLLNNRFVLVMGERFAERLRAESAELEQQVELAMQMATQRPPDPAEKQLLVDYAQQHGLANMCRFMFNLSEFVFVD